MVSYFFGPEEIRTPYPRIANAMLYQLSYGPGNVGTEGIEPSTSSLSEKRSTTEPRAH